MTLVEYLQSSRETNKAWLTDFRARYSITEQRIEDFDADELYEAHTHHTEYGIAHH